jgi:hypothetical protein
VLDEWVERWRTSRNVDEIIIVGYADDFVMGFKNEARFFLVVLKKRLSEFGLT